MIKMSESDLKVYEQYNLKYLQKFGTDVPVMVLLVGGKFDKSNFIRQVDLAIENSKPINEDSKVIY